MTHILVVFKLQNIFSKKNNRAIYTCFTNIPSDFKNWFITESNIKYKFICENIVQIPTQSSGSVIYEIPSLKAVITIKNYVKKCDIYLDYADKNLIQDLINKIKFFAEKFKHQASISILTEMHGVIQSTAFDIKLDECDIELNYGIQMKEKYDKILCKLKSTDKGLILFHGDPGTGKTSLIKRITKEINKEIIFISSGMADVLTSPKLVAFLMSKINSILIIEDAEKIIKTREGGNSSDGVSNILNLTDGILGDCLKLQIIATYNTNREFIDKALLRKGRLIAEHEFKPLSVKESNNLLKHLGSSFETTKPMTLAEMYNIDEDNLSSNLVKVSQIGFKTFNHAS